ncbi:hypothetical protein KUTeg_000115 [Tegillarca granosa]|uniref:COX assembly mitochondrial protein n=1 Tax=Tegillarca granosa TaxID=220873 RepID=A0ABQ9FWQ9_TEGGR|nr:hypothetical protein KUTeg_000115 [Tegillarca granosa]
MGLFYSRVRTDHSVLPPHMTGGPMGFGDPDDHTLRKIEEDVVIPEKVRRRSRREKCPDLVKAFSRCGREAGLLITVKCEDERKELVDCLVKWFHDKEFVEETTKEYIRQRSVYRRTGQNIEYQERMEQLRENTRKQFWEDFEKKKQENLKNENKENT